MAMSVKHLATGVAAVAAVGAAAAGVTSGASGGSFSPPAVFQVQPVALGESLPLDPPPAPNLPSADALSLLCNRVADPGASYSDKAPLVQGGISPDEGRDADHKLRQAYRDGKFPQTYTVTNIQPAGPDQATADVAIAGPKLAAPLTQNLTFVNQDGTWVFRHDSALALIQAATA
jgi:hypothetical protein